ncbi:hypothetical protein HYU13_02775 [Candidatus Woesearchaeota archaeon]|nr:hypothetical protein [Candidatus Woesearchaeota archaeon]
MVVRKTGNVGIGTTSPTAKLDVDGVIRGKAVYSSNTDDGTRTTTSATTVYEPNLKVTLNVSAGDTMMVLLSPSNMKNSGTGTCYMMPVLKTGFASGTTTDQIYNTANARVITIGSWITISGSNWGSGSSMAVYQALADSTLEFTTRWHASPTGTTCSTVYRTLAAWVIGKS